MKLCPQCSRTYSDVTLNFCLEDGTPLKNGSSADEPATALLHSSVAPNMPEVEPNTVIYPAAAVSRDSLLLIDFENQTGEAIFDHTLKTALTFSLGQSPFLDIVPDAKVAETLRRMK